MEPIKHNSDSAPLVTIGMPVYNGENYLRQALDSLLSQSVGDFEIIVSDNASEDKTPEILAEYAGRDSRIRYFRQPHNIGPAANYRFVLDQATGEFFMWAAHDDLWDSNWIEALLEEMRDDDLGVRGAIRFLRDDGTHVRHLRDYAKGAQMACFMGNENNYRCHYTYSLFRRERLAGCDFSPMNLDYSPDNLFIFSIVRQGNLRSTKKTAMTFRIHPDNLGLQISKKWKGLRKIAYRIHPLRYYVYHLRYLDSMAQKALFIGLVPIKHIYAQVSFWIRGARELATGKASL